MADDTDAPTQKLVEMPRAVHQLRTGPEETDVIEPGTVITKAIADEHGLDVKTMKALIATGAIDVVDVLTI